MNIKGLLTIALLVGTIACNRKVSGLYTSAVKVADDAWCLDSLALHPNGYFIYKNDCGTLRWESDGQWWEQSDGMLVLHSRLQLDSAQIKEGHDSTLPKYTYKFMVNGPGGHSYPTSIKIEQWDGVEKTLIAPNGELAFLSDKPLRKFSIPRHDLATYRKDALMIEHYANDSIANIFKVKLLMEDGPMLAYATLKRIKLKRVATKKLLMPSGPGFPDKMLKKRNSHPKLKSLFKDVCCPTG
jgi:hypothetical protein